MGAEEAWLRLLAASGGWPGGRMGGAEEGWRLLKEVGLGASTPRRSRLRTDQAERERA